MPFSLTFLVEDPVQYMSPWHWSQEATPPNTLFFSWNSISGSASSNPVPADVPNALASGVLRLTDVPKHAPTDSESDAPTDVLEDAPKAHTGIK